MIPFAYRNKLGETYMLRSKGVALRGGKVSKIYFFTRVGAESSQYKDSTLEPNLPEGYGIRETGSRCIPVPYKKQIGQTIHA